MLPLKKVVIKHLESSAYSEISSLSKSSHKIVNTLVNLSYDKSNVISWKAMEALGIISAGIAASDPETVRNIVGRLLWMIRDESGGIGWSCPEMLGEIVRNNPDLCADIAPIIVSFHEEKMLLPGVLWAIGRMGSINDATVAYAIPVILPYLQSDNSTVRSNAAYAIGKIGAIGAAPVLEKMIEDDNPVMFYENGNLVEKTVGQVAMESLEELTG